MKISTSRLIIRPRSLADLEHCLAMDRDPAVTKFIDGPWADPEAHRQFLLIRMSLPVEPPFGYWSIFLLAEPHTFLGWVMVIPKGANEVEVGWRLNRASWGHGFATEAADAVLDAVQRTQSDVVAVASIHPENLGSIRVAEKLGMVFRDVRDVDGVLEHTYTLPFLGRSLAFP